MSATEIPADLQHLAPHTFLSRILRDQHGFLRPRDVDVMRRHPALRLTPVLIRAHGCRCTAPAQDVDFLVKAIDAAGGVVRDCSLPAR